METLKGICTKLEFKAMIYITGISKKNIIQIISFENYFSISTKESSNRFRNISVDKSEIYTTIKNHHKSLLLS